MRTASYLDELVAAGLLIPLGRAGRLRPQRRVRARRRALRASTSRARAPIKPEVMRFPPVFTRKHYLRTDHMQNFPDLMGSVHTFTGDDREHMAMLAEEERAEDWTRDCAPTEVMLMPAACYPIYPTGDRHVARGRPRRRPAVASCFRHEPSRRSGPHADLPAARVRAARHARAGARPSRLLARTRRRAAAGSGSRARRSWRTIRSSAAAAACMAATQTEQR